MGRKNVEEKQQDEWISLFDGKTLDGWSVHSGFAKYHVEDGVIVGTTVKGSPNSFLCTDREYGDFILEFVVNVDPRLNSGVQIRSKIAEAEKIEVADSEVDDEIEKMVQGETEKREELQKYLNTAQSRQSVREILISRKTMERIMEIASSSAVPKKKKSISTKEVKDD